MTNSVTPTALYATSPLADYPAVRELLTSLDFGGLEDAVQVGGRNPNWIGTTATGLRIYVKYELGHDNPSRAKTFFNWAENSAQRLAGALIKPIAMSEDGRAQIYPAIDRAITGQQLAVARTLTPSMLRGVGQTLAALHSHSHPTIALPSAAPVVSAYGLEAVDDTVLQGLSAAQIKAWQLIHNDVDLRRSSLDLLSEDTASPTMAAIHGDLRLDQLLGHPHGTTISVIDWEEFGYGPVSRDIGSLIGDVVNVSVVAHLFSSHWREEHRVERLMNDAICVARERVSAFVHGYCEVADTDAVGFDLPSTLRSAVRYAGWHQFDRLVASAEGLTATAPVIRALAGIGRELVMRPDASMGELGIMQVSTC